MTYMTTLPWTGGRVFIFFPTLDKQLLNYTVSLLATNQSSTVVLEINRTNVMQKPELP